MRTHRRNISVILRLFHNIDLLPTTDRSLVTSISFSRAMWKRYAYCPNKDKGILIMGKFPYWLAGIT